MWPARTWLLEGVYVVLGWRGLCQSYQKCPVSLVSLFLLSLPVLLSAAIDHSKKGTRALHWVFSVKITAFQSWWNLINKVLHLWFVLCALKKSLSNPRSQIVSLCFLLRFHLEIYLWCVQQCHLLAPVLVSFSVAVIKSPDRSNREDYGASLFNGRKVKALWVWRSWPSPIHNQETEEWMYGAVQFPFCISKIIFYVSVCAWEHVKMHECTYVQLCNCLS